ncbi:MAG: hypothetical protein JO327_10245 [Nitrososphaeraceae archaeon]|nr:hypothetical protein [Nitrososphaeraceae archaeon]MBV9668496.1 hypothetical protein [Nitrososphaeraceae archaeon]
MTPLTTDEINMRNRLIEKFRFTDLTMQEAQDLRKILEKEREQAIQIGDVALVFAVGVLLGTVIDYLYSKRSWLRKALGI